VGDDVAVNNWAATPQLDTHKCPLQLNPRRFVPESLRSSQLEGACEGHGSTGIGVRPWMKSALCNRLAVVVALSLLGFYLMAGGFTDLGLPEATVSTIHGKAMPAERRPNISVDPYAYTQRPPAGAGGDGGGGGSGGGSGGRTSGNSGGVDTGRGGHEVIRALVLNAEAAAAIAVAFVSWHFLVESGARAKACRSLVHAEASICSVYNKIWSIKPVILIEVWRQGLTLIHFQRNLSRIVFIRPHCISPTSCLC